MAAQKRDKEETELKVSENLHICTAATTTTATVPHTQMSPARSPGRSDPTAPAVYEARIFLAVAPGKPDLVPTAENRASLKRPREVSRCSGSGCRKRIGLVGFQCRCGDTFCSEHRYSDRHDCSYDYKAAGREAIARENPVIKAAKLLKV